MRAAPSNKGRALRLVAGAVVVSVAGAVAVYWLARENVKRQAPRPRLARTVTVAGAGPRLDGAGLCDPFGVAVAPDGSGVFATDGAGGRVFRVGLDGSTAQVAEGLDMPSAIAVASDGSLVVANTGANTIVRVDAATGAVTLIAGAAGERGFADGAAGAARFDGPIGVAVAADGAVLVADTYNDRVRRIERDGTVRTIAGGDQGYADGDGAAARFDTPCGLAVAPDNSLVVADAGNRRLRRVDAGGIVSTLAGSGDSDVHDGPALEANFAEPIAVAFRDDRSLYVADAAGAIVRLVDLDGAPMVTTIAGAPPAGLADGALDKARFNRPSGIAVGAEGELFVADAGNGLVRALVPESCTWGSASAGGALPIAASAIRAAVAPRWPFDPPDRKREIAATFGELRGERRSGEAVWFHNGLDIPGAEGETARAVFGERVALPIPAEGVGGERERLRLPLFGYIHVRVGRDRNDKPLGIDGVSIRTDERGKVRVRVRRGTRFRPGDAVGTLNNQNHVHMIAGPARGEINALTALELPGLSDRVPPTIEGVAVTDPDFTPLVDELPKRKGEPAAGSPLPVTGPARVLVRAYDQVDGNAGRRRLGVFRIGYQVLDERGSPAEGFEEPAWNLVFERLPSDAMSAWLAYADGSRAGHTGETVFVYIATNVVKDGEAREGFWNASALAPGRYTVRVFAEDFFGNRATRDLGVTVAPG